MRVCLRLPAYSASAKVICFTEKLRQRDRRTSPDLGSLLQSFPNAVIDQQRSSLSLRNGYLAERGMIWMNSTKKSVLYTAHTGRSKLHNPFVKPWSVESIFTQAGSQLFHILSSESYTKPSSVARTAFSRAGCTPQTIYPLVNTLVSSKAGCKPLALIRPCMALTQ